MGMTTGSGIRLQDQTIVSTQNGQHVADACASCGLGCRGLSIAPARSSADLAQLSTGVPGSGVLKVVSWLCGAPLLVLLGVIWALERLQLTSQPLLCGLILMGTGGLVLVLAKCHGGKLLNMMQPQ